MHLRRIEAAPGSLPIVPADDVAVEVAGLGLDAADTSGSPAASTAAAGQGCFNASVARMLTHWKEN